MPRIGLFGGSFDPVHLGHLLVARAAIEELSLSRLFLIPAAQSPFKPERVPAAPGMRLRLLRLALAGESRWEIDVQEIQRGGTSYTVDTVLGYARRFPNAELFYLLGADHLPQLAKWRAAEELARMVEFVVVPRPEERPVRLPPPFRVRALSGFPVGVSSSQIRARVQAGLSIGGLVSSAVAETIRNERLYL